jgi:flagellar biosynthetic protein FliR
MIAFSLTDIEALVGTFLWPLVRILALFSVAPVLGNRAIPARARIGLAIAIALVVAPALPPAPPGSLSSAAAVPMLLQQMLVGFAIGFSARVAFAAIELAGDLIGLQMGLSFAGFVDPQQSGSTPLLGSLLVTLGSLVFVAIDGHLALIASLVDSFRAVPVGTEFAAILRWERLVALGSNLFANGLHMALPVLATLLTVNIAIGIMARAAPALNLFSVGFPMTVLTGLGLLWLMLPAIGTPLRAALEASLAAFP